jgi:hypothetical protein
MQRLSGTLETAVLNHGRKSLQLRTIKHLILPGSFTKTAIANLPLQARGSRGQSCFAYPEVSAEGVRPEGWAPTKAQLLLTYDLIHQVLRREGLQSSQCTIENRALSQIITALVAT